MSAKFRSDKNTRILILYQLLSEGIVGSAIGGLVGGMVGYMAGSKVGQTIGWEFWKRWVLFFISIHILITY